MVKLQIDALASCACTVFRFCGPPESFFLRWALSFAYMFSVWLCATHTDVSAVEDCVASVNSYCDI